MKEQDEQSEKMSLERDFFSAYDQYAKSIYRHVYLRVNNRHLAEDLVSETFLKSWNYLVEGKKIGKMKSFLYRVANNLIVDYYRQKPREALPMEEEILEIPEKSASLGEKLDEKISMESVMKNLNLLPENLRDMLVYKYVDELSVPEISRITGKSAVNVYVSIHRALKALKNLMLK